MKPQLEASVTIEWGNGIHGSVLPPQRDPISLFNPTLDDFFPYVDKLFTYHITFCLPFVKSANAKLHVIKHYQLL